MFYRQGNGILFLSVTVAIIMYGLAIKGLALPLSPPLRVSEAEKTLKLVSNLTDSVEKDAKDIIGGLQNDQGIHDSNDNANNEDSKSPGCYDWQGKLVPIGEKYSPNTDMCNTCICDKKHFPISCHSVLCLPPSNCEGAQLLKGFCCEYECKGDTRSGDGNSTNNGNNNKDDGESITNLSLRLIASTVTSFLVLALLLFMVHRLRQRRLLQAMRRFEARSRQVHSEDTDSEPYIPDGFMSVECPPYTDPPPPYSPPKPPQIMPGEQPPPYEEIQQNAENAENRHNTSGGNNPGAPGPAAPAAATIHEGSPAVQIVCDINSQGRLVDSRHLQSVSSGGGPLRAQNTLPAYASTDVIDGLGVVITPGNDLVSYSPYSDGWAMWLRTTPVDGSHERSVEPFSQQNFPSVRDRPRSLGSPSTCRIQAMPTITAFQRFSNIFKRDSWKARNRRRNGRPVSEYSNHHHYATIPRNETIVASGANHQDDTVNTHRPARNRLPDRMCLSYCSPQETYTFGLVSPSSSNSSSSAERPHQHYSNSSASAAATSMGPPGRSGPFCNDQAQANSSDRAPFTNDVSPRIAASRQMNGPTSPSLSWVEGRGILNESSTRPGDVPLDQSHSECRLYTSPQGISGDAVGREPTPQRQCSSCSSPNNNTYQSLASFIKSNPSTSLVNSREHVTDRHAEGLVHPDVNMPNSGQSSEYIEQIPSPDMLPKFFSTFPLKSFQPQRSPSQELEQRRPSVQPNSSASGSSLSSSPSPTPTAASSTSGIMRRSLSALSQTSIFSVCSETGEKKLKSIFSKHDDDAIVFSADAQYLDYQSLPLEKTSNQTLSVGNSTVRSITDLYDASQNVTIRANQDLITGVYSIEAREHSSNASENLRNGHPSLRTSSVQNPMALPTTQTVPQRSNALASTAAGILKSSPTSAVAEADNYNLNSILVDKSPLNKELPSLYDDHLLNRPETVSSSAQCSSKACINTAMKENQHSGGLNQLDNGLKKSQEAAKKSKKKRVKERSVSSPQFVHLAKAKHSTSSPKHVRVHLVERKTEEMAEDKVKPTRVSDKKLKTQFGLSKPTVRFSESHNPSKLMTRSLCDGAMSYGNADVYRSVGADTFPAASSHPLQPSYCPTYTDPWVHQDHPDFLAGVNRTVLNDLNQPPNHLPQTPSYFTVLPSNHLKTQMFEAPTTVPPLSSLVKFPESSSQLRKKTAHRRSGDKFNAPNPSRHKARPKSLVAPLEVMQDKKDQFPRLTAGEAGAGRGAKSGFGYDLNFVDQNRISDWHGGLEPEFTHKRFSAQNYDAPYHNNNVNTFRFTSKADSNLEAPVGMSKNLPALHPGNKSGLSNELSFVIRGAGNPGRSKKRQSVPASVSTFSPQNHLDRITAVGSISKPDEGEVISKARGDKALHTVDRMTVSDDYSEATSYV